MRRSIRLVFVALGTLFLVVLMGVVPACHSTPPNVLLVTVAGLRADRVDPDRTPGLARLPGRVQGNVVVPVPDTAVALEALVTGHRLDGLGNRFGDLFRVPAESQPLAERMARRGLRTVAWVGDGTLSELTGLARGFAEYHVPSSIGDMALLTDELYRLKPRGAGFYEAEALRDGVGSWLSDHGREAPFFLWVHLADLSAAVRAENPREAYGEALARVDASVADIVGALRTYGLDGTTVVAVVSLHGEALGVRGETGHGIFLSDEVIRVPAWVCGPGGRPLEVPGDALDLGDIGRAVAAAAGVDVPGEREPVRSATWWPSRLYGWPNDAPPGDAAVVLRRMATAHRLTLAGNSVEAREALREIGRMVPGGLVPRTLLARNLGNALRREKDPERRAALERELDAVLAECRRLAGKDVARRFDLARVLVGVGRRDEAIEMARGLEGDVVTAGERLALAQLYAEAGASDRAAELVGGVAEVESGPVPELWTWQGDLLRRAGNTYRARQAYERALGSSRGRTADTLAKLGDCLADLGEKDAALRRYAEAVNLDPSYRYPHARAAEILLEQGKRGEAATAIAMSVPDAGDPVTTATERARRMLAVGLHAEAAEELRRALERKPGNAKLLCWLARVYIGAGQVDGARELLQQVLESHPDNPFAWEESARIAALRGDQDEAVRCLERAETYASPLVVELVHEEEAFRRWGENSPLGRLVSRFGTGRKPRRLARPSRGMAQ